MLALCFRRPVCYFKFENNFYYQLIKQLKNYTKLIAACILTPNIHSI